QRSTSGWGSVPELMNPQYSAGAFLDALKQVPNWQNMPLSAAAQTVQVSAFPDAYAQHEYRAQAVVDALMK
ncbi:MAG TPA: peptidase M23, partial [Asanoa sp.]|nr:peptidase M23 [Asanoa sp.]